MSLPELIRQACVLEATARKLGNVHPRAAFVDLCYADFVTAADAIAPVLGHVTAQPLGERILAAVRATRALTGSNVNLGIVLLLAPLSQCDAWADLSKLLAETTVGDAAAVYEAIWHAHPCVFGTADEADVSTSPRITLTAAMQLAADRDLIARQYATSFAFVRSGAGLVTIVIILAYWGLLSYSIDLGRFSSVPVWLAMQIPNISVLLAAILPYRRAAF